MSEAVPVLPDGTPERLGRYRLVRPLSTGGMARVFEARRESIAGVSPKVAIKVILPDFATDESFRALFVQEARVGSVLHHQNLVQIQDFDREGKLYYLVMEYVEGFTLRRAISLCKRQGLAPILPVIADIGRQICDGLHHAHTAAVEDGRPLQLIHRDVKPSNLMCNPQGVMKVLDFGISKALIHPEKLGAVRGTWGYMGPEQADGKEIGPSADLYGLAAVLYELATLQPLFPEKEPAEIRPLMERDEAARRASRIGGSFTPLGPVLVRALQRDPMARYTSAAAMSKALMAICEDPATAREETVKFYRTMAPLALPGAIPPTAPPPEPRPAVRARPEPALGLPVTVRAAETSTLPTLAPEVPRSAEPRAWAWWGPLVATAFLALGAIIVVFTGWKVYNDHMIGRRRALEAASTAPAVEPATPPAAAPAPSVQPPPPPSTPTVAPTPVSAPAPTVTPVSPAAPAPAAPKTPTPAPAAPPPEAPALAPAAPVVPEPIAPPPPAPAATAPAAAPRQTGTVTIGADLRAKVSIDGAFVRFTPLFRYEIRPGTHTVLLQSDDGRTTSFQVEVVAGQDQRRVWSFERNAFE